MTHDKEQGLLHTAGSVSGNVPAVPKRYRSFRSKQTMLLFYGVFLGALLMFDGVVPHKLYRYPRSESSRITNRPLPDVAARGAPASTTEPVASSEKTTPRTNGSSQDTTEPTAQSTQPTLNADVCWRLDCQDLDETLSKMDTAVDPCDDFYGYACGGFASITKIPDGQYMENTFTKFDRFRREHMISSVTSMYTNQTLPYLAARNLYDLCMDTDRTEKEGNKILLDILDSLGGWPVLIGEAWNTGSTWTWEQAMKNNRAKGYSIDCLFDVSVEIDLKNASRRILYVDQPTLGISREDLVEGRGNPNVEAYLGSMINASVFLGANESHVRPELEDLLGFEIKLARFTLSDEHRRNAPSMYNVIPVEDFQGNYDLTNWTDYFNSMLEYAFIKIDKNEPINVKASNYLDELSVLLDDIETPNRTIANYIMWRVVQFSSSFLTKEVRKDVLGAKQKNDDRTKECADITIQRLPLVVKTFYDKILIDDASESDVLIMANEIMLAFVDTLSKVDWMDESTRETALEKMQSMDFHIAHTDEPMDDGNLTEYYRHLEYNPVVSYLSTVLYIDKCLTNKKFEELRQAVKNTTTYLDPVGVEVHYSFSENKLRFAPYYLLQPFFSDFWPMPKKYGVMGPVIGRAIARSFADQRWQFDKIGSPAGWCKADTGATFMEKAFSVLNQHVRQKSSYDTLAEKITDTAGILSAYQAYQKWAKKNDSVKLLPNITNDQMFWLSAAQTWCSVYRPEATNMCITTRDQFRVIEPMRNLVEFSSDFNCTLESRMNPVDKSRFL